jgi:SAM-dependent methyltransferase
MAVTVRSSRVGERLGIDWLTYNPLVVAYYHERARANAPGVFEAFGRLFPEAQRYLDVGAGSGAYAAEGQRRGFRVAACERSRLARWVARVQGVRAAPFDLRDDPPARLGHDVDLVYCFEVAEHLEPRLGERLVAFLASAAPIVIFTAAPPGQGGTGHVNEQPRDYWISRFEHHGMRYGRDETSRVAEAFRHAGVVSAWLPANVMVFAGPARNTAAGELDEWRSRRGQ